VLGPEINPKRILDLLPIQNYLFHVQFLTVIKDRSSPQAKQKHQHHLLEALAFPLAFEAAHQPPGIMVPQGPAGPSILKMVFCQFHDFGEITRIHLGKNLNDQKNTNFQNVLEIDHLGINFTLKESQVSVKQIIEIQEQETVRMFCFQQLRVTAA